MWGIIGSIVFGLITYFCSEAIEDSPKKITPEWESKVFGINHKVTTLDKSVLEMVDGLIDGTFDKEFIGRINRAIKTNPTGTYEEYWANGALKARLPYKDGKAHGHIHAWYDNGRDAFKGHFNEGVKQGIHITFFPEEKYAHQKQARRTTYTEKGDFVKDQLLFHPTGRLWLVLPYENGVAHGPLEGWDSNRKYFLAAQYDHGVLQKEPPVDPSTGKRPRPKPSIHFKYVNEVEREFKKYAYKTFGARACGSGGAMPYDVENIGVDFDIKQKVSREKARELIVTLTEKFTEIINKHEQLRPYLREYPFSPYRADVYISFCDKKGFKNKDGSVNAVIVNRDKEVCYFSANPLNLHKEKKVTEPYEEAVKIVHGKNSKE